LNEKQELLVPSTTSESKTDKEQERTTSRLAPLTLAALGIVYGDIGTSPLYAIRECFAEDRLPLTDGNVLGVLSLVVWSLLLVISLKYLTFAMRADNDGEGGILALMMLAVPRRVQRDRRHVHLFALLGLFGAGLLYGDGAITPAISVLSAVEGVNVAAPNLGHLIVPAALVILLLLFLFQHHGTARVGRLFGPIMLVWFFVIAGLGVAAILRYPAVLRAVSPHYAVTYFLENRWQGLATLGVVFLVVTGGEALYADMGHFGPAPIRLAWFLLVLPALLLNYFGQGALLLTDAASVRNPFYSLAPEWALYPLTALATVAAVIASQAVISGAFSLSFQAVQLDYLPRLRSHHTSKDERGQVYVPAVNWLLFAAVIGLVLVMGSSSALAGAYGMAITTTMVITAVLLYLVARRRWNWSRPAAGALIGLFLTFDLAFFAANVIKIPDGGWFPLVVGGGVCAMMVIWRRGTGAIFEKLAPSLATTEQLLAEIAENPPTRIDKPAVYLVADPEHVPLGLTHNLRHNRVLHQPLGLLTIVVEDVPWVPLEGRLEVKPLQENIYRLIAHYGFKQRPNVPNVLQQCRQFDLNFDLDETTYFLGRVTLDSKQRNPLVQWRNRFFIWLSRNANDASAYFNIPADRVVEIGMRIEL
jgi:KUP system potassium uptake protein